MREPFVELPDHLAAAELVVVVHRHDGRRRDEEALATVADRGLEELAKRQLAELAVQLDPRRYRARYGARVPAERVLRCLDGELV